MQDVLGRSSGFNAMFILQSNKAVTRNLFWDIEAFSTTNFSKVWPVAAQSADRKDGLLPVCNPKVDYRRGLVTGKSSAINRR